MTSSEYNAKNTQSQWEKYCNMLWFNERLGMWLDISRININNNNIEEIKPSLKLALEAMNDLEDGSIANKEENRRVGHYWLRNPNISPDDIIKNHINEEIQAIKDFGINILNGNIKNNNNKKFTDVLWIGIGGSGLGPLLVVEAIKCVGKGLDFHFIDNIDPEGIRDQLNIIESKIDTTLFVVVSKSGNTPEPKLAMEQVRKYLQSSDLDWTKQSIAITMKNSKLDNLAKRENWLTSFDMPDWVGRRTSITSAVGLLPAILIGADIDKFLEGASFMDKLTRESDVYRNPAALLALAWISAGEYKGIRDMVILPYKDRLQVFSRYLQQLVMESLGKKEDRRGNIVNQGIAVYGNKGSTDQHAYVQQLRDGIDNFFVTFIEVLNDKNSPTSDTDAGDHLSGFLQGTRTALSEGNRQSLTITIKEFDIDSLGALIALFERAVGIYAELIDVNAYNQPGVEAGKIAAAEILQLQSQILKLLEDGSTKSINDIQKLIPDSSKESIFWILRHYIHNRNDYIVTGDWSNPIAMCFKKQLNDNIN